MLSYRHQFSDLFFESYYIPRTQDRTPLQRCNTVHLPGGAPEKTKTTSHVGSPEQVDQVSLSFLSVFSLNQTKSS